MHRVVALALPAVAAFDLSIPAHVFGHDRQRFGYAFALCAPEPGEVSTTTGFSVLAPLGLEALGGADTVVVPGYLPAGNPGERVVEALRTASARGARIVSVCVGAFALAHAGLLDGRRATTHWDAAERLARDFPRVTVDADVLFCHDGNLHTSAGVAAGIDLCLDLVRADRGAGAASAIARAMVVAPHRAGGQRQFVATPVPASAEHGLGPTRAWALERLDEPLSVDQLAVHAGWSPRTFARRFLAETGTTPLRWLTEQRVARARELLEATRLPVEAIADATGLGGAANLRRRFRTLTGTTPSAYRATFRDPTGPMSARAREDATMP